MANSWTGPQLRISRTAESALVTGTFFGADDGIRTRDPHLGKVAGTGPSDLLRRPNRTLTCASMFVCNAIVTRCCPVVHGTPTGPQRDARARISFDQ